MPAPLRLLTALAALIPLGCGGASDRNRCSATAACADGRTCDLISGTCHAGDAQGDLDAAIADASAPDAAPARVDAAPDAAVPPDAALPPDATACQDGVKRVFVTSAAYGGNLGGAAGAATGVAAGDSLCNLAATAASLGGNWTAWLSTAGADAIDRIADVGPWYSVDGCSEIFPNRASVATAGPLAPIELTEHGTPAPPMNLWTGTEPTGRSSGFDCAGWSNDQPIGGFEGTVGVGDDFFFAGAWTEVSTNPCHLHARLICFER